MSIPKARVQGYMAFPIPTTPKPVKNFLGSIAFYSTSIKHFAEIILPLHTLTKNKANSQKVKLTTEQLNSFYEIKESIANATALSSNIIQDFPSPLTWSRADFKPE
jgi:hypothetical protein